jgi:nucleotide-binding universal stress UspA family protein
MSDIPASEELVDVVFAALDHGIDSVRDGGALVPFVLAEDADGRSLTRFAASTLEESQAQARQHAEASGAARVALAFDGYLTIDGERSDAILVEAQERGTDASVVFAQRYRPGGRLRKFSTVGNAAFTGPGDGLF